MENADKWFAIVNPVAGSGRGLADWPQISKLLRDNHIVPEYAFTERKYHAIELAVEAVNNGFRKLIVVGATARSTRPSTACSSRKRCRRRTYC